MSTGVDTPAFSLEAPALPPRRSLNAVLIVVCQSMQALAFGGDVAVVALVCAPTEKPGIRRLGPLTVISIGLLDDLRPLLAKGSAS